MIYKFKEFKDEPLLINHLNMGGKNPKGEEINVTSRYFTRNGKPWIGVMGEFHFSRYSRENWHRELAKMKADDNLLINLGSMDLQPSFDWKKVEQSVRVITPDFKVWKNGKAETIVIYAKMARGQMTRYIVKNRITNPDALKDFTWEGFRYREDISSENNWIFLQD